MIPEFASRSPRERSGPRSANRFDYQLSWAFCLLLDLESDSKDYLMVLDHHDDVVVFDSETQAEQASFYQIKTSSSKKWTLARLIERSEGTLSILGKLYAHRVDFQENASVLNFVSDQVFSLPIEDEKKPKDLDSCQLSLLCSPAIEKVKASLKEEHALEAEIEADLDFIFKRDAMSGKGHRLYAEGKFSEFLARKFGDKPYMVSNAFRALLDLLRQRNNFEGDVAGEDDLRKLKSIGRSEFAPLLQRSARLGDGSTWQRLEVMLVASQLGVGTIRRYQSLWQSREVQLLDFSNFALQESQLAADRVVEQFIENDENASASAIISAALTSLREESSGSPIPFSEPQAIGAILSSLTKFIQ